MIKKISIVCFMMMLLGFIPASQDVVFADDGRMSQTYDETRYDLMTYADNSWYEWIDKSGTTAINSIKNFLWNINIIITKITLMIVYQLFSLDIIELTKDSIMEIASGTAGSLLTNLGMFAFAIACMGVVIRAYIQQNWQAFFKIVTLVVISMALLFSISSKQFNYVDLAHNISVSIENAVMKVNPSLTESTNYEMTNGNIGQEVSIDVENKAFNALLYKPYLLLQYGTTDEEAINAEGSLNGDETRIEEYLKANPSTEDGIELRKDIAKREFTDLNNENIFTGNAFKISGYVMGTIVSTIIQGIVFFFLALMRIMLQFAFVILLLLAPFMLFISIFPTFEGLVGQYLKGSFMVAIFKALTMFLILVSTSLITLSYEMVDMSDDIYYRIFIHTIFSIAIIFMYMKRQFLIDMINGSAPSLASMGAGEGMGRASVNRTKRGSQQAKKIGAQTTSGIKKSGKIARQGINRTGKVSRSMAQKSSQMYDRAGQYAGAKATGLKQKMSGRIGQAKDYVKQVQDGDIPNYESPYHTQPHHQGQGSQNGVAQTSHISKGTSQEGNVTSIHRSKGVSMRDPFVAQQHLKSSSLSKKPSSTSNGKHTTSETSSAKAESESPKPKMNRQFSHLKDYQSRPTSMNQSNQVKSGRNPYDVDRNGSDKNPPSKNRESIKRHRHAQLNREGKLNKLSLLHDDKN